MERYIVIEKFDKDYPSIVTDEDGMPKIFETKAEALIEAGDCQDGLIVNLNQ